MGERFIYFSYSYHDAIYYEWETLKNLFICAFDKSREKTQNLFRHIKFVYSEERFKN
jgi:hypothetical protein